MRFYDFFCFYIDGQQSLQNRIRVTELPCSLPGSLDPDPFLATRSMINTSGRLPHIQLFIFVCSLANPLSRSAFPGHPEGRSSGCPEEAARREGKAAGS